MATIQETSRAPWRARLVPASFSGIQFHVEQQSRNSGRRVALHEYPKRNDPYAEDMGKQAIRYQISGYLIGPDYHTRKAALVSALESSSGSALIDPYIGRPLVCICERYSVTEVRDRGGYCTLDMTFVEVGKPGNVSAATNSASAVKDAASSARDAAANMLDGLSKETPATGTIPPGG